LYDIIVIEVESNKKRKKFVFSQQGGYVMTVVSPYAAAKLVNEWLVRDGSSKQLPPQMFYNYVRKQYIPSSEGKVEVENLQTWYAKYAKKNGIKVDVVEIDHAYLV
jgi:hypothetical protein